MVSRLEIIYKYIVNIGNRNITPYLEKLQHKNNYVKYRKAVHNIKICLRGKAN